ncbi:PDZ domain-containing protein [Agaribacter marinus]|uniref:Trypsin-like peptidase domain-containing protein n=1 Tax=Virgibacillus salarius TaxID=447199 RepID=A0A941IA29_9BACI|nr:trypsin-like peptidase domain-containing protein [Virgibacillus salarius]MBR7797419.1 trypsin-like peptidase domain-containing protein [Virgibacillus salarius]NAZ10129.1 PDZ domain-containing protein [Agaribacter marinus]
MGYYDEHYPPNPYRKRKKNWLVPVLLGVIIGVLLVTMALPALVDSGIISITEESQLHTESGNTDPNVPTQTLNVDVSTQITDVVNQVTPAVVGVINIQRQNDFWQQQESDNQAGEGSGVIYKNEDGTAFVVTNHHVVEGADTIEVVLFDETHIEAELIGSDLFSDLAVLRMDGEQVDKVIELGSSGSVKVGEPAIAIGNPLGLMFSSSVTQGVISGTERTIPQDFNQDGRADWQAEVIQTDAAINPGNSGGALINIKGQLIGINSMKINETAVEGLGFAIPIDSAMPIITELESKGEVTRPYLGVEIYSLDEVPQSEWNNTLNLPNEIEGGVYVWSVEPLSPADQAGLKRLDVITELDGKQVMNMIDLRKILYQEKEVGDDVSVVYYRDGKRKETTIKLGTQK